MATQQPMTPAPQPGNMQPPAPLNPEQEGYRQIMVKQAMKMLLNEGAMQHIITKCKATRDPAGTLVGIVTPLLADSYRMASVAGKPVEITTILAAGLEVISQLAVGLSKAGVIDSGDDAIAKFVAQCVQLAVQQHNMGAVGSKMGQPGMAGVSSATTAQPPPQQAQPQGAPA